MAMEWGRPRMKRAKGRPTDHVAGQGHGEWAPGSCRLVILACWRAVPYGFWRKLHKLFGPLYLMGAFHGVMLFPKHCG